MTSGNASFGKRLTSEMNGTVGGAKIGDSGHYRSGAHQGMRTEFEMRMLGSRPDATSR